MAGNFLNTARDYFNRRKQELRDRERDLNLSANPLDLSTDMTGPETFLTLIRATLYARFYAGRFFTKYVMNAGALAFPVLILPWPIKIVVDHVVLSKPIAEAQNFPFYMQPLLDALEGKGPVEIMIFLTIVFMLAALLVGAYAPGGATNDTVEAGLEEGHDTATQVENSVHGGHSFASGLWGFVEFRINARLTQSVNHHLRSKLFERIKAMPITTLEDQRIGDAVYRVMYDTPSITMCFYEVFFNPTLSLMVFLLALGAFQSAYTGDAPEVVILAAMFLPVQFGISLFFTKAARRRNQASRAAGTVTTSTVEEGMDNILAVQSLGGNQKEKERFGGDSVESFKRYRNTVWVGILYGNFSGFFLRFVFFAMFFVACYKVIEGSLTAGDYGVLWFYFHWMRGPASSFATLWLRFQGHLAGMRRVFAILDMPIEENEGTVHIETIERGFEMKDVGLVYPDGRRALQSVDLNADIGQIVAFVGPTGSGKTSLAYLVPRFHKATEGEVLIDGINVNDLNLDGLRSQVTYVFQETQLFSYSILENIRFGNPDASVEEVERVARIAGVHDFIDSLPEGYETKLGTTQAKLSVGQKQRIAIARGLIRQSKVLILDEPTSALDPETETFLVQSLHEAAKDRLVIIIAHRLSTIMQADNIVFLDEGSVLEQGTHQELMGLPDGHYRQYVELQTVA